MANFGPADYNYDETISTLRYANRAKNIKNKAKINEDPKDALLRQFQKEIDDLKKQLTEGGGEILSFVHTHADVFAMHIIYSNKWVKVTIFCLLTELNQNYRNFSFHV